MGEIWNSLSYLNCSLFSQIPFCFCKIRREERNFICTQLRWLIKKNAVFIWKYYSGVYLMWLNRHRLPYITLSETENTHSRELYFILWIQLSISYSERLSFKRDSTSTNRWINYIKNWHVKYKVKEAKLMQIENLSFNTELNLNEFFFLLSSGFKTFQAWDKRQFIWHHRNLRK